MFFFSFVGCGSDGQTIYTSNRKKPKANVHADWFKTVFLSRDRNTELAQAVDVMMA